MEPRQYTARQRGIKLGRIPFIVKLCTLLAVAVLGLNTVVVWRVGLYPATTSPVATAAIPVELDKPVVWVYAKAELPMSHVVNVFDRLGYSVKELPSNKWNVLWSHQYPFFNLDRSLKHLQPHQKVNHFPGTSCFVSKPILASHGFLFTPKAFKIPDEADRFKEEARQRPSVLWVQKSNKHRGIKIKKPDEIPLDRRGTFVQEFLTKPFLVDGRKFDIGVYVTITSVDPLRVYLYSKETLIRFCSKDYEPFDAGNPKRYVVDDYYTPVWEIPSLRPLVRDHKLSHSEALNEHLRQRGYNSAQMWRQTTEIIQKVLHYCEHSLITKSAEYPSSRNFFELVRFDFVLDSDLKVWLMEVNLSPNLSSSHTLGNRMMYEQIVFNVLSLVGLARATGIAGRYNGQYESVMVVSDQDTQVPHPACTNGTCADCNQLICKLCSACLSREDSLMLKTAFLEHLNRRNFIRIIPPPVHSIPPPVHSQHPFQHNQSTANYLMTQWFDRKCLQNPTWCS